VIETELDPDAFIRTRVNGELKQDGKISDMVHDIPSIVAYASSVFTLLPGDVILTGTPSGIGPIVAGDTVEVEIEGVGSLVNPVRAAK
jgi:2-keto-4-pentenoate hydratase/2-oxohepta-3-ene-1,7-dioic acid hydratase in catechol pathway